jgi:hypothetical protein
MRGHYVIGALHGVLPFLKAVVKVKAILNVLETNYPYRNVTTRDMTRGRRHNDYYANHSHNAEDHDEKKFMVCDLLKIVNPARSKIWKTTGHVDHARLDTVVERWWFRYRQWFDPVLAKEANNTGLATWVWGLPISWEQVTSGSWDELFLYFKDAHPDAEMMSAPAIREFYMSPELVFERRRQKLLDKLKS